MEVWRDVSLLWLILLTFFAVAPFGVLFFLGIKGMIRLRQVVKKWLPVAQEKAGQVASGTEKASRKVVAPLIGVEARLAQLDSMRTAALRRK